MSSTSTTGALAGHRITGAAATVPRALRRVPTAVWITTTAAAIAAIGAVELTGAIAGTLHAGRPVLVNPAEALGVIGHWLSDTGVRRGAWPVDVAEGLGRYRQVRAALVLAIALLCAMSIGCWVMWRSTRIERLRDVYKERGARWAKARELAILHVKRPTPGRIILGRRDTQLIASQDNASTLIIAPSQAGKTTGLAVPAMVEWAGPILATSVKGDLLHDTIKARKVRGEVKVFDPTGSTSVPGSAWSPVAAATTWSAARRLAASILQVGMRQHGGQDDSFWRQAGAAHLAPLLFAGNYLKVSTATVLTWATSTEEEAMAEALAALRALTETKAPGANRALHDLQVIWKVDSRYRSNVIGTLSTHLDAWKEPALEAATAHDAGEGITPEWLLDGNNALYLSAPADAQRRLRGLFCALVTEVVAAAFARSARTGRPLDSKLLLMMDEAANIAPLPNIDEIASTGPGQGVLLCTILQNLSQAEEVWGKDRADTILANHRARLFGPGIGDTATLEYISRILGDEVRETSSISRKRAAVVDLGSRNESQEHRALLGHHETRQMEDWLLVYGHLPPTQIQLRPWFQDPTLKRLVAGTAPTLVSLRTRAQSDWQRLRAFRPGDLLPGRRHEDRSPQARKLGLTVEVQLGRRSKRQLSIVVQGTPPPQTTTTPVPKTGVDAPAAPQPPSSPGHGPSKPPVASPAPKATPAPSQAPRNAQTATQLTGQLTLDEAGERPAAQPQAQRPVRDVRAQLDRHLGDHAAHGVAALRLAACADDQAALIGPHALVLQDADDAPAMARWGVAELVAAKGARKAIAARLLEHGAACQTMSSGGQTCDRWTAPDNSCIEVHVMTDAPTIAAIAAAIPVPVDGIGTLKILPSED